MSALLRVLLALLAFTVALTGLITVVDGHLGPLEIVLFAAVTAATVAALLAVRRRLA
jgi:hypothetical protein